MTIAPNFNLQSQQTSFPCYRGVILEMAKTEITTPKDGFRFHPLESASTGNFWGTEGSLRFGFLVRAKYDNGILG